MLRRDRARGGGRCRLSRLARRRSRRVWDIVETAGHTILQPIISISPRSYNIAWQRLELTIIAGNPTITNHLNHHRSNTHPTACRSGLIHTSFIALTTLPIPCTPSASVVQSSPSVSGALVLLLVRHSPPYPKLPDPPPVKLLNRSPTDCFCRTEFVCGTALNRPSNGAESWPSRAPVSVP